MHNSGVVHVYGIFFELCSVGGLRTGIIRRLWTQMIEMGWPPAFQLLRIASRLAKVGNTLNWMTPWTREWKHEKYVDAESV